MKKRRGSRRSVKGRSEPVPNQVVYTFLASDRFTRVARSVAKQTRSIRTQLARLGPIAKNASRVVVSAFGKMKVAARGFMTTGLAPLVTAFAGIAGVLKFFAVGTGFQDAMADLSAITSITGKDLAFLREESLRLGKASRTSSSEVATALKLIASSKSELVEDPKALSVVAEQMLLLKNATGLELAEATSVGVGSLNQFGAGAEQAARFVNVLAAGAKIGAAEVGDIGQALKNVGPVADIAGLSFEDTNAAIQILAKANIKGSEAGTKLRGVLLKLNDAIPFDQVGGFANALEILASKGLDLATLKTEIFGEESIAAAIPLLNMVPLLRKFTKEMTGTSSASEQAAIRMNTLRSKAKGLAVILGTQVIQVFDKLAPQFDEVIVKTKKFFDSITTEDVDAFASQTTVVLKTILTLAGTVFKMFKLLGPVIKVALFPLNVALKTISGVLNKLEQAKNFFLPGATTGGGPGTLKTITAGSSISTFKAEIELGVNDPKEVISSIKATTSGGASLRTGINREGQL